MTKEKVRHRIFLILLITFLAGNLVYPVFYNRTVDFINQKFSQKLSHFWDIPFKLGLDLQGGSHLLYQADISGVSGIDYDQAMEGLKDVIERRVNSFGVSEPVVQTQKAGDNYRLIVELAGVVDPAEAIKQIGQTPFLEFKEPRPQEETDAILKVMKEAQENESVNIQDIENWQLLFQDPYFQSTELTGRYLEKAEVVFQQGVPKPLISLDFNEEGAKIFEQLTERNIGKPLAIYIDNVLMSSPVVQDKISGGQAQITGNFSVLEARELVRNLNAGALPLPIELISQQSVGPILGKISLEKSLAAGLYGFLFIVIFMVVVYRLPGVVASLALFIYTILLLCLFKVIPITLSLAGIAGVILSLGMAVDANILTFARMKEEFKEGKSFKEALEEGFNRSWPPIRDANFTTLIVCFILFDFGTSFVKGFALTLGVGVLVSMFSAIFVTRYFLRVFVDTKLEKVKWLWNN